MNPIQAIMNNMVGGGGFNPIQMLTSFMSGNANPQQLMLDIIKSKPEMRPVIDAFESNNPQQAFNEMAKINPQAAQAVSNKSPEQLQQMAANILGNQGR